MLPDEVMQQAQESFMELGGEQASVMEISHRGEAFLQIYNETIALIRELLNVPEQYAVLLLPGGATGIAAAVAMNMLGEKKRVAYAITGHWSRRSHTEAARYCEIDSLFDEPDGFTDIPPQDQWRATSDAHAYCHYVDNETIHGVEFGAVPEVSVPLVCDVSSNILSRPLDITRFGCIYAGAQKNLGITGISLLIVDQSLITAPLPITPGIWNFQTQIKQESMFNTIPTFPVYTVNLVLNWLKRKGGVGYFEELNRQKAALLYDYIDGSDLYRNEVAPRCRSRMNIPFFLNTPEKTDDFLGAAGAAGLIGLKGHVVLGGCRASIYNAMPLAGVEALVEFMEHFERKQ